eukprot:1151715-Pelagomonas_calceolata.AAC.3
MQVRQHGSGLGVIDQTLPDIQEEWRVPYEASGSSAHDSMYALKLREHASRYQALRSYLHYKIEGACIKVSRSEILSPLQQQSIGACSQNAMKKTLQRLHRGTRVNIGAAGRGLALHGCRRAS